MCGICGIIDFSGAPINKGLVRQMNNILVHRGPDEEGYYFNQAGSGQRMVSSVALGHRRLSIIDLASGKQPLSNEDKTIWIVFNGEIYNYRDLREELLEKGHRFRTRSDTEVIVHLYEEKGEDVFTYLNGMFALAIWDGRKQRLILARDRLGKKPVYYCLKDNRFLFASELKALLVNPEIERQIAPEALSDYLAFLYIPAPATIFKDVYKLEPATYLVCQNGQIKKYRYWEPQFEIKPNYQWKKACKDFLDLLEDVVQIRLESEVPLGAFLSGGIDSSTVVAVMARLMQRPVDTTSIGFKEVSFNELPYARQVAQRYHTHHNEHILEPDFIRYLPRIIYHLDEPFADSSALPTYLLCQMTRRHVTVALSGDGGDENFAGYTRYSSAMREELWRRHLPLLSRRLVFTLFSLFASPYLRGYTFLENLTHNLPRAAAHVLFCFDDDLKERLFTKSFKRQLGNYSSFDKMEEYFSRCQHLPPLSQLQYVDLISYLPEDIMTKVDRMSMAHALETRAPLLDYRVVEFAGSLPPEWKLKNGEGKYFLKKVLEPLLPHEILYRSKQGFSVPIGAWFRGRLQAMMEKVLFSKQALERGYFEPQFLKELWQRHLRARKWEIDLSPHLWALFVLELWHRIFIDN